MYKKNLNILFLYSELVSYNYPIFQYLVEKYGAKICVVYWDLKLLKPLNIQSLKGVDFKARSSFTDRDLISFVENLNVDLVYISGWMDIGYLKSVRKIRSCGVPVVSGIDDKWNNSLRQIFGSFIIKYVIRNRFISHLWVSGPQQYEYAKRMGYTDNQIIFDLLAIDINASFCNSEENFIYVGNFRYVKGFDILVEAYKKYKNIYGGKWGLICVGNGELSYLTKNIDGIITLPFSSRDEIIEISKKAKVMILPSRNDMWGVVVHEFVSLGKALILSENVGASSYYLINNFNGRIFKNNSTDDLAKEMIFFSNLSQIEISNFMNNSLKLKNKATVETSCANFLSILN
jgi:glycosyltransferase involved in cell wall biosynthesis